MTGLSAVTMQIARLPFELVLVPLELPPGDPCLRAVGAVLLNVGLQRLAVLPDLLPLLPKLLTVLLPVGPWQPAQTHFLPGSPQRPGVQATSLDYSGILPAKTGGRGRGPAVTAWRQFLYLAS